jgi:hypothetical protein
MKELDHIKYYWELSTQHRLKEEDSCEGQIILEEDG